MPAHWAVNLIDAPENPNSPVMSDNLRLDGLTFRKAGNLRLGNTIYATRCSARFRLCITAYMSNSQAMKADLLPIRAYMAFGGLLGAIFGMLVSLAYRRSHSMEQQLLRAIRDDKLRVVYQPIVELNTGRIVGAEALVRWTDEDGLAVGPDIFVKIAEELGYVGELTQLVLRHALRDMGSALREDPGFHLSVNVTVSDLKDPLFLTHLEQQLKKAYVSASSLTIEITEGSTARNATAMQTIRKLRERGHRVHVDDFGTGYSSLAYLHDLDVDAIKIDRAFTQAIGTEAVTVAILPQILAMAEALKLQVIVEGVETGVQADYFTNAEMPMFAQGWLYGHPVPAAEFRKSLIEDKKNLTVLEREVSA
jgi:sensor c-di-GMP phosphodiesterase-like protein